MIYADEIAVILARRNSSAQFFHEGLRVVSKNPVREKSAVRTLPTTDHKPSRHRYLLSLWLLASRRAGRGGPGSGARAKEAGASAYLPKPFSPFALLGMIRTLLPEA